MTLRELKALKSSTALDFRFSAGAQNYAKITGFCHFIEYEVYGKSAVSAESFCAEFKAVYHTLFPTSRLEETLVTASTK